MAGVLAMLLVACGTSTDEDSSRIESVKIDGPQTGGPGGSGETGPAKAQDAEPLQISPEASGDETEAGLRGPEFYRGSGVLARGGAGAGVDVGVADNGRITLNFANAQIRDVIDVVLGDTLNANYIIDSGVQGQVTVRTSQPLSRADVIPALENILALNGVALTLVNGTYMVVPQDIAATGLSTPMVSPTNRQLARGFGINVIPLNFVSATSMQEILEPFVGPGSLRADTARNILIYSGSGSEARDLLEMVRVFDVDWMKGMSFALFPIEVADVTTLVSDLEAVFLQDGTSPLAGLVRFVPIERLNAVLAISPQLAYLDEAESWIDRLDRGLEGAGRRIFVYYVENGRAADLADILSQVFEGTGGERSRPLPNPLAPGLTPVELNTPAPAAGRQATPEGGAVEAPRQAARQTPRDRAELVREGGVGQAVGTLIEGGSEIRIIADEASNALLVLATASEFRMIEATLKKLDVIPLQVLIEATIAEVSLNDQLRYGLQWFFESGEFSTAFAVAESVAIDSLVPGFSVLFDSGNQQALLNALTTVTDVEVISSPSLMVLDNQSARLQVGDQVPIATSQSTPTNPGTDNPTTTSSIQQVDTGVILEVTPRVNTGGLVVMEIVQEVSQAVETESSELESPTIQQRRIESTVAVQSGETIALGGLIRDDQNETINGIPLLSDIPILGHLFKTTSESIRRVELLVLITPRVVRNQTDARKVTEELRRRLKSIEPLERRIYNTPKSAS